ncbi:MAG: galactokinase family protein, partial [Lachnospiraceae bacterium]|nr:galactokinase family protein [Lachnospiraceae bacterium]
MIEEIKNDKCDDLLLDIYVDPDKLSYQKNRYIKAIGDYKAQFGEGDIEIYSAPGRSEIGGNHTDHQHGEVLAASINNDAIAVVKALHEPCVKIISDGFELITVWLEDIDWKEDEKVPLVVFIPGSAWHRQEMY